MCETMEPPMVDRLVRWRHLVGQHLGQSHTKRSRQLMLDLLSVDCGLKPALLLDFAAPGAACVCSLLSALRHSGALTKELRLVTIGLDVLIVNPAAFDSTADAENVFSSCSFVNISVNQEHPQITPGMSDCLHHTRTSFGRFLAERDRGGCIDIPVENDGVTAVNPSTLFGVMLGYPIVYYYDMSQQSQDNCLSMVPLVHFVVSGVISQTTDPTQPARKHSIFSFSVPEMLVELIHKVETWFVEKRDSRVWCSLFSQLELERNVVQFPSVCL